MRYENEMCTIPFIDGTIEYPISDIVELGIRRLTNIYDKEFNKIDSKSYASKRIKSSKDLVEIKIGEKIIFTTLQELIYLGREQIIKEEYSKIVD